MKKFIALTLALILTASLAACGGGDATGGTNTSTPDSSGNTADSGDIPSASEISLSGEIGGEITISCYDTMKYKAFLEDAAKLFEEKYPGTKVNIETFSAMPEIKTSEQGDKKMVSVQMQDDPQGRQDYINKTNTSLMSGEGADILAMDVLPVNKYADSGQLENLALYMDADPQFNRADYQNNVLDAVEYKNGTWFLPMDYTFDYYAYDSTLLTGDEVSGFGTSGAFNTKQLVDLASPAFDASHKLFDTPDYVKRFGAGLWGNLLEENYSSFVNLENKTANFDDGGFAALLETVKAYSDKGYVSKGVTGQSEAGAMMRRPDDAPTDRVFFKPKNVFNLISLYTRHLGMRMTMMAEGGTMTIGDDDEIAGIAAAFDGSVPFTYDQAYGINAGSDNKETAWAFLTFLLSEEMQLNTNISPMALPLRNTAREQKMELVMGGAIGGAAGNAGQSMNDDQLEAISKYNETVKQLSGLINSYVFEDTVINDMISAEVEYFFDGTKTADEVANVLQSKVGLYLSE